MLRRFSEWYLCRIGSHQWSLFRRHGDLFKRECERSCGSTQTLDEKELNFRRRAYDDFIKSLGKENYDNPYWRIGDLE